MIELFNLILNYLLFTYVVVDHGSLDIKVSIHLEAWQIIFVTFVIGTVVLFYL